MEAALVVDCRQDLVDVGLEHHAAHDYLVKDVVNLPHGEEGRREEEDRRCKHRTQCRSNGHYTLGKSLLRRTEE